MGYSHPRNPAFVFQAFLPFAISSPGSLRTGDPRNVTGVDLLHNDYIRKDVKWDIWLHYNILYSYILRIHMVVFFSGHGQVMACRTPGSASRRSPRRTTPPIGGVEPRGAVNESSFVGACRPVDLFLHPRNGGISRCRVEVS